MSSLRLTGTGVAALLFAVAAITPSVAQSSDPSASKAKPKQTTASRTAKPTKPIPREALRTAPDQKWTIENALPDHSASMRQYDYVPPRPKLGRVPLQSGGGTVGVETDTKSNPYKTPDGRTIPGLEASDNRSNSYVGLSLSVPTSNNAMNIPVPVPLQPLWGRP